MKLKTLGRIVGAYDAFVGGVIGAITGYGLYKTEPHIFSQDLSTTHRLFDGGLSLGLGVGVLLGSVMIVDGLTDLTKGTHHYFGCILWQKLTRNPETKREIQSELEEQLRRIEEDF